ncbi:hypothetical protein H920_01485 [Fukomys damarensis]|uniref:Uncharacterized protein n=1 Tax=Fukomys damarensis TaxID=885580 RepID=A0A091DYB7_FUKDA|nr:hypothetical protein H920_01485 [Fukomys damarensis]
MKTAAIPSHREDPRAPPPMRKTAKSASGKPATASYSWKINSVQSRPLVLFYATGNYPQVDPPRPDQADSVQLSIPSRPSGNPP